MSPEDSSLTHILFDFQRAVCDRPATAFEHSTDTQHLDTRTEDRGRSRSTVSPHQDTLALFTSPINTPSGAFIELLLSCDSSARYNIYVTNPVHVLPFIHHQRSLTHHIDSCTTRTVAHHLKIQFPSSIGTDVTQLITLITLTPENSHTITITQSLTLYKPCTSSCSLPSIVCAYRYPSR